MSPGVMEARSLRKEAGIVIIVFSSDTLLLHYIVQIMTQCDKKKIPMKIVAHLFTHNSSYI